jgi:ABC-2 type transport system permease protein
LAQSVLFRDASVDIIWPQLITIVGLGLLFLSIALGRFRIMLTHQM